MNTIKALFVVAALSASALAMAEGGGDRVSARIEQSSHASTEARQVAQQQKAKAPIADNNARQAPHANC